MLVEPNRMLDFDSRFYTTTNRDQAIRFAKSVVVKRGGVPMVNVNVIPKERYESFMEDICRK